MAKQRALRRQIDEIGRGSREGQVGAGDQGIVTGPAIDRADPPRRLYALTAYL